MTTQLTSTVTSPGTDRNLRRFDDIRDLLPDVDNPTPLVRVPRVLPDQSFYLKLEWLNPFGSIKDRAAAYLLAGLEGRDIPHRIA